MSKVSSLRQGARARATSLGSAAVAALAGAALAIGPAMASPADVSTAVSTGAIPGLAGLDTAQFTAASSSLPGQVVIMTTDLTRAVGASAEQTATGVSRPGWQLPVAEYTLTARFGEPGPWSSGHHTGLDFAGSEGEPVMAVHAGEVRLAEYAGAYGNMVLIDHGDGTYSRYAHLQSLPLVTKGTKVVAGQQLGLRGSTGNSTGPHLHFEILKVMPEGTPIVPGMDSDKDNGALLSPVNPLDYLPIPANRR